MTLRKAQSIIFRHTLTKVHFGLFKSDEWNGQGVLDDLEVRGQLAGGHHAEGHAAGGQLESAKVVPLGLNGGHCRQGPARESGAKHDPLSTRRKNAQQPENTERENR